jgi:hypothetical protein
LRDPDPLGDVWTRADVCEAQFSYDEVQSWPQGREALLTEARVIRRCENATSVVCDACHDGHVEDVVWIESPPGSPVRTYIDCPEAGCVAVPLERLTQWIVDFDGLAAATTRGLDLAGEVEEVVQARLWSLGRTTIAGRSREVFLARGTTWADADRVFGACERLNASRGCLVLVPGDMPSSEAWTGDPPSVVPLKLVAHLDGRQLAFDRYHLESLLAGGRRGAPIKAQESFPTPPGTTWRDVRLRVTDTQMTVEVKRRRRNFTFQAAGFEEKRKGGVPDKIWTLLRVFATHGGVIPYDGGDLDSKTRTNLKQYMTVLRKRLRGVIPGIDADPVPYDWGEHKYRMAFKIATEDGVTFPVPSGTSWPDVTITLTRSGAIRISVPTTERYAASTYTQEPDGDVHRREQAERESELARDYDMRTLGLADEGGRPNTAGKALIELLRKDDVLCRPDDDDAMLGVCEALAMLMTGIDGSPFDLAPDSRKWIALFQTFYERQ